jgi:hypothetical protein
MTIIDDLVNAIEAYPHESISLEVVAVDPPGIAINTGEDVLFRIQASNSGPLDVNDLTVLVEGLNGTEVRQNGAAAQFVNSFTTAVGQFPRVPAHQPNAAVLSTGSPFHFEAPNNPKPAGTPLVRVSVAGWNTDFNHVLGSHSDPDSAANATFSSEVAIA